MVNGTILGENKIISFVIPVYNIENKYFERCLKSFINQGKSFNNIELIIVNDCSPLDENDKICKLYEKKYSNLTYIKLNKNSGVSTARFVGLSHVKTEFCCFFDSDDFLIEGKLETLLKTIINQKNDYDIWKSTERFIHADTLKLAWKSANKINIYTSKKVGEYSFYNNSMIGGKILKTDIAKDVSIFNQKIQNHEDLYFILCYLSKIDQKRIAKIDDEIFNICIRENSASKNKNIYEKCLSFIYYLNLYKLYIGKLDSNFLLDKTDDKTKFLISCVIGNFFKDLMLLFNTNYQNEKKKVKKFYKQIKQKIYKDFQIKIPKTISKQIFFIKFSDSKLIRIYKFLSRHQPFRFFIKITKKILNF